ncbi:MAG TPA: glycoside hydrolase family 3 C-terminal domain-containing protein, partial [Magnetospirillaceae bacterium]|nr:glycoside hydrolase family 3 C-terminal domain-containing protein [Magnetospirillaceae bacterium]
QLAYRETPMDGDGVPTSALLTPDGKPGVRAEYFGKDGKPIVTRIEPTVGGSGYDLAAVPEDYRAVWSGFLVPPESGTYRLGLTGFSGSLEFDGKPVKLAEFHWGDPPQLETVTLEKGKRYPIRIATEVHGMGGAELLWKRVFTTPEEDLRTAAASADLIVAAIGLSSELEGEEMKREIEGFSGGDKTSLDLPADQRHLLEVAKSLGKPLIVVLFNGSPLDLSWAKQNASAIVEAWYPGQAGGLALADVLSGRTDPSGRLPLTFYHGLADLPPFGDYAMKGRTYRYFTGEPVYPFGFGLSYTSFAYGPVKVEQLKDGVRVTSSVTNKGDRAGEEVAELYLTPPAFEGAPRLALRGFQHVALAPGESRMVSFDLSPRDLSFVTRDGDRQVMPGTYQVSVGSGQPGAGVPGGKASFEAAAMPIAP